MNSPNLVFKDSLVGSDFSTLAARPTASISPRTLWNITRQIVGTARLIVKNGKVNPRKNFTMFRVTCIPIESKHVDYLHQIYRVMATRCADNTAVQISSKSYTSVATVNGNILYNHQTLEFTIKHGGDETLQKELISYIEHNLNSAISTIAGEELVAECAC